MYYFVNNPLNINISSIFKKKIITIIYIMYLNYVYDSFKEISNILRYKETKELSKIVGENSSSDKINYLDKESNKLIVNSLSNYLIVIII